ncbi:hypothetical protein [uncultured Polaribacter sp.]|uniref:hypothetical protein n=1 Tax=uncultured Polaribacter sp. TaxID=174711 RepID=UPI00261FCBB2|nr:hypothetical protein [uncultured Polaribacter sp.]
MNYLKRIFSLGLSAVILLTHLIALEHSLDHSGTNQGSVFSLELEQISDSEIDCSLCDIYLDIEISKTPTFTYSLLAPKLIKDAIFKKEDDFTSIIFYLKKSRAPPTFTV